MCSPIRESRASWVMRCGTLAANVNPAGVFLAHERATLGRGG
ncbi:MAG TPA: hypothetical protein VI792_06535 [Candidatus Eisenbacteria bacterium]